MLHLLKKKKKKILSLVDIQTIYLYNVCIHKQCTVLFVFIYTNAILHLILLQVSFLCTQHCFQDKPTLRASLVAQWLRICLLMQGTRVRALVWEDPTCRGAAGPVSHGY